MQKFDPHVLPIDIQFKTQAPFADSHHGFGRNDPSFVARRKERIAKICIRENTARMIAVQAIKRNAGPCAAQASWCGMKTEPLPRQATLIVNAHSRKGQALFEAACEKLKAAGVSVTSAHAVTDPAELQPMVRAAVEGGTPMLIMGGGDGSLSGVVDELVGSACVFAVLPLGTANSFARSLDLPLDLDGAIETIANGRRRRVDLGMIDGDYFVNGASIGLSTMIGDTVPHALKRYAGRVGYLLWALKCSVTFRPFKLSLTDGSQTRTMWATELRILNGRHHGGVELSERADVDSRELLVQAVVGRSKLALATDWYAKFFKLRSKNACSEDFRGTSFRLTTVPAQRISVDGEVLACTPVTAKVAPGAIDVAVPT